MTDAHALRLQLLQAGYLVIPLYGKVPPIYGKNNPKKGLAGWQKIESVTPEMLNVWERLWPEARNTGCLTRPMPTLDADLLDAPAAKTCQNFVRERYGYAFIRIGKPPKFAIPFRTEAPFKKIVVNLIAPDGSEGQKIEFLGDGEQVVVAGIHPDTQQPYHWSNGGLERVEHKDLPLIHEQAARELVDELVEMLIRDHGYQRATARPQGKPGNGGGGKAGWAYLYENIHEGRELHDSIRDLAAMMICAGTNPGGVINQLNALMQGSKAPKDERWLARKGEIPAAVDSAITKFGKPSTRSSPAPEVKEPTSSAKVKEPKEPTSSIQDTIAVFRKWLILKDTTPVYAMIGTVAANLLPGDPVWLGLIAPPSSAKTELLNSITGLPNIVQAATITPSGLLSGTPKKQHDKGARGGLLRQIGEFGIIILKDFGSIISMHAETRAETLAALREVYDGSWTRHLGAAGGKTLAWQGKVAVLFGATEVIDTHHAIIGAMGDRFLLSRLRPVAGQSQFTRALVHAGGSIATMRKELAEAVTQLFASRRPEPSRSIDPTETEAIGKAIALAVRLRGAVERDRRSRELEMIYGAEGTARIGLALERLLAGLDTLGVDRTKALAIVKRVALDSVPPLRRRAYDCVRKYSERHNPVETADVAVDLGLPTNTARRILEDLAAHGLVIRRSLGKGKADIWDAAPWEAEEARQTEEDGGRDEQED
jgi:Bifunctional DNA primase/polymerase, N-terminal/FaeA-like protein